MRLNVKPTERSSRLKNTHAHAVPPITGAGAGSQAQARGLAFCFPNERLFSASGAALRRSPRTRHPADARHRETEFGGERSHGDALVPIGQKQRRFACGRGGQALLEGTRHQALRLGNLA
jgi:hypothetical protein